MCGEQAGPAIAAVPSSVPDGATAVGWPPQVPTAAGARRRPRGSLRPGPGDAGVALRRGLPGATQREDALT